MAPLVSVIVPAYRAGATILAAVRSALAAGLPEAMIEILIESDDGSDYAAAAALSAAVRPACSGEIASGCGATRNRAIARAQGDFLAFLDADDLFAPDYLAALLPLARAEGAAAAPLQVVERGKQVLSLWQGQDRLDFGDLAASGASVRLMLQRRLCPLFVNAMSQDILHAVTVMAGQGGSLPLSASPYILRQTPGSLTSSGDVTARLAQTYAAYVEQLTADPAMPGAAAAVFRAKQALNDDYGRNGGGRSYYRYIADRLSLGRGGEE